ncbi:hypothetical protein JQX13_17000 [Archangium violaceum]|uniref:hypothetical protein n=1 Tax=Archangium violaceum TaxID=83451 RepID=UPI00193BCE14|nr:hypothetical protein [Archangium violaceum]QRK11615.1 hypothetical protein JQX13_17000 [Archangium violaceum]
MSDGGQSNERYALHFESNAAKRLQCKALHVSMIIRPFMVVAVVWVLALAGCVPSGFVVAEKRMGWRAHATAEMLRLYDEFGAPTHQGVLERKADGWAEYVFADGRRRMVIDDDGNGRPGAIADDLPDGTMVTAVDSDQDGRPEWLAQQDGNGRFFDDTNYNGTFDRLRTVFAEGDWFRVRIWVDEDEDGHFEETESWLEPAAMPVFTPPQEHHPPPTR